MVVDFEADVPGGNWVTVGSIPPWSVLDKGMQKWSQSRTEQWKNLERVMEKEREWKDKIKGRIGVSGRGARWGEGWTDKSVAWAGSLGRGSFGWLLGSKGAHIVKVANGC